MPSNKWLENYFPSQTATDRGNVLEITGSWLCLFHELPLGPARNVLFNWSSELTKLCRAPIHCALHTLNCKWALIKLLYVCRQAWLYCIHESVHAVYYVGVSLGFLNVYEVNTVPTNHWTVLTTIRVSHWSLTMCFTVFLIPTTSDTSRPDSELQ